MKITIDMPNVAACEVSNCAFYSQGNCHARAITVGDGAHPACDTYLPSAGHTRDVLRIAGVGACKVTQCTHNEDYECQAAAVRIGRHESHADCQTYAPRA